MNRNQLFEAIGEVDPELLAKSRTKVIPWRSITAAAAACLVLVGSLALWKSNPPKGVHHTAEAPSYGVSPIDPTDVPSAEAPAPDNAAPNPPPIDFKTPKSVTQSAYDIALPEGHFFHEMTPEEIGSMFNLEQLGSLMGYPLTGSVIYDGNGDAWEVFLNGGENGEFYAEFSPEHLPFDCCVVQDVGFVVDYYGIELTALEMNGRYEISALYEGSETVGFRASGTDKAALEALAYRIAVLSHDLKLSPLHTDEVPEWRSERMDEATARAEAGFAEYLPVSVPDRFTFDMAYRELGQGRDYLAVDYRTDDDVYGYAEIMVQKIHADFPRIDPERPETYDRSDYAHGGEVPEEYQDTYDRGVFLAADLTPERVAARCCIDPEGYKTCELRVLYPDDTLVWITGGITPEEAWQIVSQFPTG